MSRNINHSEYRISDLMTVNIGVRWMLLLCIFFIYTKAGSQVTIKGRLVDSVHAQILYNASIQIKGISDSLITKSTTSDSTGSFQIPNIISGIYSIRIKYTGFKPKMIPIAITITSTSIDLNKIYLQSVSDTLPDIIVATLPMQYKKDTLVFNAGSYKTSANADLEELLKKLPGLSIDGTGVIRINGETIESVLVDGKVFFGNDIQLAIKNLPAEIFDKIKIYSAETEKNRFMGTSEGAKVKTMDLVIKKNRNIGMFGKLDVGIGPDGKYSAVASYNRFKGKQQISFTSQSYNINAQNPLPDINNPSGQNGIITTRSAGVNYRDTWWKNTDVTGSYNVSSTSVFYERELNAKTFFANDSTINAFQQQTYHSEGLLHRIILSIDSKLDTHNTVTFKSNINLFSLSSISNQQTFQNNESDSIYRSVNDFSTSNKKPTTNEEVGYKHFFSKTGRTASIMVNTVQSNGNETGFNNTNNIFLHPLSKYTFSKYTERVMSSNVTSITAAFVEPLKANQLLEFIYKKKIIVTELKNMVFNIDSSTNTYSLPDQSQSNSFNNEITFDNVKTRYKVVAKKIELTFGVGLQGDNVSNVSKSSVLRIAKKYLSILPQASIMYNFSEAKKLQVEYDMSTMQPVASQLQPVVITNDSLNIWIGNPGLKQSRRQNVSLSYSSHNTEKGNQLGVNFSTAFVQNDIQNSVFLSPNGVQTVMPVNVNGSMGMYGNMYYGMALVKNKLQLSFNLGVGYSKNKTLLTGIEYYIKTTNYTGGVSLGGSVNDKIRININTMSNYNIFRYEMNPKENISYFTHALSGDCSYTSQSGLKITTGVFYFYNQGYKEVKSASYALLNLSVGKQVLKSKALEIKLSAFDLLNQNRGYMTILTNNGYQSIRTNVVQRYLLWGLKYNLRKFSKP